MAFTLRPAIGENFFNREKVVREIIRTLTNPHLQMGFALIGPRRMGKTSILKEVSRKLNQAKNVVVIYFSLWDLVENTLCEFSREITEEILNAFKREFAVKHKISQIVKVSRDKIYTFLKTLGIHIRVMDEIEIEFTRKEKPLNANYLIERIFRLVEELSQEFGVRSILIIDEFPSLIEMKNGKRIGEGVIRKIRTIQEDLQNTILCISGSIRKTMEIVTLSPSSPFYRQFIVKNIGPLDKTSIEELLRKNLHKGITPPAIDRLYELTKGIPFYVQFIGRCLEKREEKKINEDTINKSFYEMLREEGNIIFTEEFYKFSEKERLLLKVMGAEGIKRLNKLCVKIGENPNIVSKTLEHLINKGAVYRESEGIYKIVDSVFAEWIKFRFR
ncbi:ATP-binding protein [Candidatus Aerophobetes bacterium]|nr:ATP-binding protein [Candidatus Aerophobetes bacterium]